MPSDPNFEGFDTHGLLIHLAQVPLIPREIRGKSAANWQELFAKQLLLAARADL
jgi:hypothetical protein